MKPTYPYSPETGETLGEGVANRSPTDGEYLLPAFATFDPAPDVGKREVALRLDEDGSVPVDGGRGAWYVKPDWRGAALWDTASGQPVAITRPGVTPADIAATDIERTDTTTTWDGKSWVPSTALIEQQQAEQRTKKNEDIKSRLADLDSRTIRAVHEALLELVAAGATLSPETTARLQEFENQKSELRAKLLPE